MTAWVADYSASRPGGAALKAAGCVGVVRYAGALTSSFNITAGEVADLTGHGLPIGVVVEQKISAVLQGRAAGVLMGRAALADTRAAGLPDGLVYVACDDDFTLSGVPVSKKALGNMAAIADTAQGVKDAVGQVGLYADAFIIQWMVANRPGLFAAYWQTAAWSHGQHAAAALYQRSAAPAAIPAGCDWNDVLGDWHPRTATPVPPPPPPGGRVPSLTLVHPERVHPAFVDQLHELVALVGHDLDGYSTGRTDAEQQYLYDGWIHRRPGFNPANPPGGPSWHRYAPAENVHAQAIDARTVGLGGRTARDVFGPFVDRVGLCLPYDGRGGRSNEPWHIQPKVKHPQVPIGTVPVISTDVEFIVDDLDFRPGLKAYPSPRSLSATVLQAALARHGEWIVLPGGTPAPTLGQIQGALGDFQTSHLGSTDLMVGTHTKAALAVEPRNCPTCKRLGRYPYK